MESTAQEMDLDETDVQVREAEAVLARTNEESAAKRRKTNIGECDAPAGAQAELDKAIDDASRAVHGGKLAVGRKSNQVRLAEVTASRSFESFQRAFPLGARRPRVSAEC